MGNQSRLPVPLHLLRLGLGHRRPRSPSSATSGCSAKSTGSPRTKIEYIFCCDANFGIQKRDVDIANYVAEVKKTTGYPRGAVGAEHQERHRARLSRRRRSCPTPASTRASRSRMQSVDMPTLEAIKRDNISLDTYMELQRRFTRDKVETYSDLILGLPGETYESFVQGRRPADRERPAQPHPVQQPVDPAERRDGRPRLSEEVRHGHGRVEDHQHPRRARSNSTTTCPRCRTSSIATAVDAAGRLAAHPHLLLDDRAAAFRQAVPDPADPGARHLGHRLSRHDRGVHGCRPQALSR